MRFRDILLLVNVTATDEFYPSIIQHAREHRWRLTIEDRMAPPPGWDGDGALVQAGEQTVTMRYVRALRRRGIPVVNTMNAKANPALPSCIVDIATAARIVADHFRERGFVYSAFFTMEWMGARAAAADAFSGKMGGGALWAWPTEAAERAVNDRAALTKWLKGKLRDAPKPLAVMCPNSYNAVTLLNVCLDMGLSVPEDVAIASGHYDPAFCDCQAVPLTGVEFDARRQAQEAAALLERLMDGKPVPSPRIVMPPTRLVVQQSTDVLATENPLMRQALRVIRERLSRPLGAAEIAATLGIPRIRLDRLFAAELKRSVGREILRQRLARAKRLLVETDDTLDAIAAECGFCHASYLVNAFKKALGTTPRGYRLQQNTKQNAGREP